MNHIYKVIFNKATGTFMAVAEYAKSHSTGGSSSTAGQVGSSPVIRLTRVATLAILAIAAMVNSTIPAAAAAGGVAVSQSSGTNNNNTTGNGDAINAHAEGDYTVAAGKSSHAKGAQSIAIGGGDGSMGRRNKAGAKALGEESIAIGGDVTAEGDASIAIGSDDLYLNNKDGSPKHQNGQLNTLIQNHKVLNQIRSETNTQKKYRRTKAEGHASTAVGTMAYAKGHFSNAFGTRSTAEGNYSLAVGLTAEAKNGYTIAIGSNARAIKYGALAIGTDAQVDLDQGIALGYGSQILNNNNNNNNNNTAYIPEGGNTTVDPHKATNHGLFSIGSNSIKRKIINVGAGYQDTDAVNVAQLKAVENLAKRKITFTGDDNNGVQKKLGETLTIKGGKSETNDLTEDNIGVVKDNNTGLKVKLAKTLNNLTEVNTATLNATTKVKVGSSATAELLGGGLTFSSTNPPGTNSKTVYGIDGVKFTDNAGTATVGATRITKNEIGFDDAGGSVDKNSPYLDNKKLQVGKVEITKDSGINAGNQEITKVKSAITKETEDQQKGINEDNAFVKGLEKAAENTNKQNSAVTVSDLNTVAQTPINFKGDDDVTTIVRLGETLPIVGGISSLNALTDDDNIGVVSHGKDALKVRLAKDLKSLNSVNTKTLTATDKITVGSGTNNAELLNSGLTFTQQVGAGKTVYGIDGVKFTDGSNATIEGTTRIDKDKIGFAKADGTVDDNLPHLSKDGIHAGGKAITGLPSTLPSITNAAGVRTTNQGNIITKDEDKSKAASIGDILNTGFNLKNNGEDKDFVSTYDTVDFIDGNATTAKVTYDEANQTSKVAYDVNVDNKTIELTGDNGKKNKIGVKTTTLTTTNASGNTATNFSVNSGDEDALVKASDIKDNLNTLAGEIHTTKGTADTALQTFQVKKVNADGSDDDTNAITVGKDGTSDKVNTLKLKGENGLTVATNKDGTVTFGINTQSGLKAGDSTTLNNNGLSIKNPTGNEQIQVGADGVKFAKVNNGSSTGIDGTSRITQDKIGFTGANGSLDESKPHLTKDKLKVGEVEITNTGINAGGKKITNIQSGDITKNSNDAVTGGQIHTLKTELENKISSTAKTAQNSLHEFSVADEQGNNFTVSNPYSSYDTSKTSDVITFAGENGITTKVNKGVVRVGIDQTKGLTTPKLTVGSSNGKGIVIDSQNGQNTITGLSNTLANVTNDKGGVRTTEQGNIIKDEDKTRAASIVDVLSAGFNLQGNGEAVDFVSTYDTVNFADGNATTAKVTYDDTKQTSTVTYDVNVDNKTLEVTSDKKLGVKTTTLTKTSANGNATKFSANDGDALVKASDIATHLNTLAGDIQTAKGASQASSSASYVDADGNKVIYDSTDKKYYQVNDKGQADKTKEVAKDKLVAQAQTPDGTLAQMNVKSVIGKADIPQNNINSDVNEDNAFIKGLENAAKDTKTKNAAVTVNDLHQVASTPITFKSDDGVHSQVNLGDTFAITGGADYTNLSDGKNIGVVSQPDGVQFKLAKDLTELNSVSAGGTRIDEKGISFVDANGQAKANTPVLSANGLNMGGKRISNIGAAVDDNDAVNFKQFNEVAKTVNNLNNQSNSGASLPFVVTDANGNPINGTDGKPQKAIKGADGKYYHANANGVPVDKDGNPITDADKLANLAVHGKPLDAGHQVVASLGGNSDAITLTNIKATLPQIATPNTGNANAGQAQSLPSLSAAQQSNAASVKDVLNVGFNLQTNHNQVDFVKAYDTVNFVNGTGADITSVRSADGTMSNITVNTALAATDDDGNVLIKAKDGKFYKADDLMPNGSLKAGKSASDAKTPTGLSLVNPNADKGSTGDAVALNNLSKAVFKSKDGTTTTTVSSDGISIQGKDNSSITLSKDGLNVGGKVISNVGKGTKDTDAANVQQLNEVRNLLGLGNAGNDNADGNQINIADIKKDPNSGSSSNRIVIKAGTVLGGKGNNDTEKLATGGVQVGVDKDGNANGDLSNVWVKTQKDGSKKALLATYNAAGQTNYLTNNPAEAIDRINEQGIRFFHANDGNQEPVVQGRNGIDSSASGKHSVAIGFQAKADGEAAVAIGRQTQAGNQSIAIGDNAQATGDQSIAIGTGNVVAGKHSGAIGDPSTVKADNSYSVGNNNQFTDATQTDVFGVGNNITVTESNSVALGSNSAISAGTHAGTQAKKSDGTAGTTTTAGATGTVKGFAGQTAVGAVSVGASGAERRIQNVAAGEVSATSTDAVNGSQLYKATQSIANATNELDHRIHQNENKANAGISSAMAMASMPQAYIPGRSMVTGGIATHNGQGAVAVGLSKLSDNGQWVFKINGSADTQGHVGAAVGAGFHF
ncbi:adhesin [Moraxella catarrhalis]|uniref:ESPR-type extended signal peptide-containing protein n=1 Tax=Moraxella catarrhalis TaxID=480 RepID=UPI00128DA0EC|nr:YadA-like family protein [Moraxella catarrhalis]MPW56621.1 adhesin [Moraxella catarrhalis]